MICASQIFGAGGLYRFEVTCREIHLLYSRLKYTRGGLVQSCKRTTAVSRNCNRPSAVSFKIAVDQGRSNDVGFLYLFTYIGFSLYLWALQGVHQTEVPHFPTFFCLQSWTFRLQSILFLCSFFGRISISFCVNELECEPCGDTGLGQFKDSIARYSSAISSISLPRQPGFWIRLHVVSFQPLISFGFHWNSSQNLKWRAAHLTSVSKRTW